MTGTVRSLVREKGYLFIRGEDGDYFAHKSAFLEGEFYDLEIGDRVSFEPAHSDKGLRAEKVALLLEVSS